MPYLDRQLQEAQPSRNDQLLRRGKVGRSP